MTLPDLLFLLAFLSASVAMLLALTAAIRGQRPRAVRIVRRVATATTAYFLVSLTVAIASPQRLVPLGQPQCFDDWCITPMTVRHDARDLDVAYTVSFQLASRARRVAQRERFIVAYLQTDDHRRIDAQPESITVPFDTLLTAGETVWATRRFLVPRPTPTVRLVVAHEGGFRFPGCCILGDESSFLHKHTLILLDSATLH